LSKLNTTLLLYSHTAQIQQTQSHSIFQNRSIFKM